MSRSVRCRSGLLLFLTLQACGGDFEDPTPTPTPTPDDSAPDAAEADVDTDTDTDTDVDTDTGPKGEILPWSPAAVTWMSGTMPSAELTDRIEVVGGSLWALEPTAPATSAREVVAEGVWSPTWSPDKRLLVFSSPRGRTPSTADPTPFLDLWRVGADGTGLSVLTSGDGHDVSPAWSPDGRLIAFASTMTAPDPDAVVGLDLWLVEVEGGQLRHLVAADGQDDAPVFSVDGQVLYYTHVDPLGACGGAALWQVGLSDGVSAPLTDDRGGVVCGERPSVSPDGLRLYFWDAVRGRLTALELTTGRVLPFAEGAMQPWAGTLEGEARVVWVDAAGALWLSAPDGSKASLLVKSGVALPRW